VTVDEVLASRIICKPLHLLDCCVETDNGTPSSLPAPSGPRDLRHPPALIRSVVGRCCKPRIDMHYQHGPISTVAGFYARDILWKNAGGRTQDNRPVTRLLRRVHLSPPCYSLRITVLPAKAKVATTFPTAPSGWEASGR